MVKLLVTRQDMILSKPGEKVIMYDRSVRHFKTGKRSNGEGSRTKNVEKRRVYSFIKLFNYIYKEVGNYEEARRSVEASHDQMGNMRNEKILPVVLAKRILKKYSELKSKTRRRKDDVRSNEG